MRILMLSWEYPPRVVGGIARVVHDLAQQLNKSRNEVHVITCSEDSESGVEKDINVFVHRIVSYDIKNRDFVDWVHQLNFKMIEYGNRLIADTGSFDIIHVHDWLAAFAGRVLKCSYRIPMICTIHATEYGRNQGIHNELQEYISNIESWMGNEAQKAIVNSQYMKDEVKRVFGLSENKIRVIYNGVSLNKFKDVERDNEFRAKFAFDNEKIIFFVGRLVREKGVHILIEAMPKVVNYYNDVKLIIAGKGPETDNLKRMAWDMGLGKKIHFTGYLSDEDLTKLYKCADISVFPSLYEPFGIVVLESMLANVPVVVSEAGGLSEIIEHNVDGMKSYTGNANSLSDSILDLLHNPDKVDTLTKNARKKLKMKYNWRKITKETKKAYKEVIADAKNIKWEKPVDINNI